MTWRLLLKILAGIAALVCLFVGVAALKWYVWDIVIGQVGEADRSMLFWGLPIAFIGVGAIGSGVGLMWVARTRFSSRFDDHSP